MVRIGVNRESLLGQPYRRFGELGKGEGSILLQRRLKTTHLARDTDRPVPLACAAAESLHRNDTAAAVCLTNFRNCLNSVLESLTSKDTRDVIRGIRVANAGGMGTVAEYDIQDNPQGDLVTIMAAAQKKDLVARQYCNGFADVLEVCLPELDASIQKGLSLEEAIIRTHVYTMSQFPDSLIVRKRGECEGIEAMERAATVIESDWPEGIQSHTKLDQLDSWLRAVGNQRNPGTTADLVAASLFVAFCCQVITFPRKWEKQVELE